MSFNVTRHSVPGLIPNRQTWPLKITVTSTDGHPVPAEVFVFHVGQTTLNSAYAGDLFECVASVHQIYELGTAPETINPPEDTEAVDDGKRVPYYRRAELQFDCRSEEEADGLWNDILEDIRDLVANFAAKADLVADETIEI